MDKAQKPSDSVLYSSVRILQIVEAKKEHNFEIVKGNDLFRTANAHRVYLYQ
jgi:hypothetical protein